MEKGRLVKLMPCTIVRFRFMDLFCLHKLFSFLSAYNLVRLFIRCHWSRKLQGLVFKAATMRWFVNYCTLPYL